MVKIIIAFSFVASAVLVFLQGATVSSSTETVNEPSDVVQAAVPKDSTAKKKSPASPPQIKSLGEVVIHGVRVNVDEVVQYIDAQVYSQIMSGKVEIRSPQNVLVGYISWRDGKILSNGDAKYTVELKSL